MKIKVRSAAALLSFAMSIAALSAHAEGPTSQFAIESQQLATALLAFSQQSEVVVVAPSDVVKDKIAPTIRGEMSPESALQKLLEGTGLSYTRGDQGQIMIVKLHVGQVGAAERESVESTASPEPEEILVSARKQGDERVQDVPIPVSVLNAGRLASNGQVLIRDYFDSVPGLNMVANYGFTQNLSIRGITTGGFSNPIVGVLIDDIPFGFPTNSPSGHQIPDVDPGDLERIEVLRGPQGTLYGANSMGGLIKYAPGVRHSKSSEAPLRAVLAA